MKTVYNTDVEYSTYIIEDNYNYFIFLWPHFHSRNTVIHRLTVSCVKIVDRPGLKGLAEITRLSQAVIRALRSELDRNHVTPIKGDVTVCDAILAKTSQLREISLLHMDALAKFKRSQPHLEFPALHKELFSVDS